LWAVDLPSAAGGSAKKDEDDDEDEENEEDEEAEDALDAESGDCFGSALFEFADGATKGA